MEALSDIDLGRFLLSVSVILGWLLIAFMIFRIVEIGIKVVLRRREERLDTISSRPEKKKGF